MTSLLDLLTQNLPQFETRRALLVVDPQKDFLSADGKLPVRDGPQLDDRIAHLVKKFRDIGPVIWIRTIFEAERPGDDEFVVTQANGHSVDVSEQDAEDDLDSLGADDSEGDSSDLGARARSPLSAGSSSSTRLRELFARVSNRAAVQNARHVRRSLHLEEVEELFLSSTSEAEQCCLADTPGSEFAASVGEATDPSADTFMIKSHYSAFKATSLLLALRVKLATELYICGCLTNSSVYATAMDAARHGLRISVISDCLGYRSRPLHEAAMRQIVNLVGADLIDSSQLLDELLEKPSEKLDREEEEVAEESPSHQIGKMLEQLRASKLSDEPLEADSSLSDSSGQLQAEIIAADGEPSVDSGVALVELKAPAGSTPRTNESAAAPLASSRDLAESPEKRRAVRTVMLRKRPNMAKEGDEKQSRTAKQASKSTTSSETAEVGGKGGNMVCETIPSSLEFSDSSPHTLATPRRELVTECPRSEHIATDPRVPSETTYFRPTTNDSPANPIEQVKRSKQQEENKVQAEQPGLDSPTVSAAAAGGKKWQDLSSLPTLGPGDYIAEGDSRIIYDLLPSTLTDPRDRNAPLADSIFDWLYDEVKWQKMSHAQGEVPRLVAVQGEIGKDASMPVYRHPSDQAPVLMRFSRPVQIVREQVQKIINHPVNHVLIQLYRSGNDFISEHSDKTLDIVRGSSIVNVSFGAQRTMRLRTKRSATGKQSSSVDAGSGRQTQRIPMPHNSMFVLGQESNMRWLHGINADKRAAERRSEAEKAYSGLRISLTFRHIGTFLDENCTSIWGQGATSKERSSKNKVINNDEAQTEKLIQAFGKENQSTEFDWDAVYGAGFDVLHFREAPPNLPIFFPSGDWAEDLPVEMYLEEAGIPYSCGDPPPSDRGRSGASKVCYRDTDASHTEVQGAVTILFYLSRYHPLDDDDEDRSITATAYGLVSRRAELRKLYADALASGRPPSEVIAPLHRALEHDLAGRAFRAGDRFSVADCGFWPFLIDSMWKLEPWPSADFPNLTAYHENVLARPKMRRIFDMEEGRRSVLRSEERVVEGQQEEQEQEQKEGEQEGERKGNGSGRG